MVPYCPDSGDLTCESVIPFAQIVGIKQYLVRPESPLIISNNNNSSNALALEQQRELQNPLQISLGSSNHNTSQSSQSPTPSLDAASTTGDITGTECPITEALAQQILQSGRPLREVIDEVRVH